MTVSAEGFLLGNLFFNALILWLSSRMCGHRCRLRCLPGGALGAVYALCSYLPRGQFLQNPLLRLPVCCGMVALSYAGGGFPEWKRLLRHTGAAYLCTVLLGGTGTGLLFAMGQRGWGFFPALLTAAAGSGFLFVLTAHGNRARAKRNVEVTVTDRGRSVTFPAYVDTGNVLREPLSDLPVIVAERAVLDGMEKGKTGYRVPYVTVNGSGCLKAFAPDKIIIEGKSGEAMLAPFDGSLGIGARGLVPGCLSR